MFARIQKEIDKKIRDAKLKWVWAQPVSEEESLKAAMMSVNELQEKKKTTKELLASLLEIDSDIFSLQSFCWDKDSEIGSYNVIFKLEQSPSINILEGYKHKLTEAGLMVNIKNTPLIQFTYGVEGNKTIRLAIKCSLKELITKLEVAGEKAQANYKSPAP